ncbi:MAG TPA: sensor histidine kinase [Bryobacteraceae bacterium]|nr:sensor histidine kinase [Bryobacteraceae bacterium]
MIPAANVLFSSDLWGQALESYARAVHLTVKLFDAETRIVFGPVHSTPLFQLFEEEIGYDPALFTECATSCLTQTNKRRPEILSRWGLSVVGISLVLEGTTVGAAVAGYAFADFAHVAEVQHLARNSRFSFERIWGVARTQKPVPQGRLVLYGELLQVLGDALLRENSHTRQYEETVLTLEQTFLAKEQAEASTRNSLLEKEELLKEVHHRVKNNLQVIVSLLNLQARQINDKRALTLFEETRNRVQSISAIHELLYRAESFASIHLLGYARQLVPDLIRFYGLEERVTIEIAGEAATLELERAVPYGMLLNELASNACKHAFSSGRTGRLIIEFQTDGRQIEMKVADDGPGLPQGFDYSQASSLGLKLIHGLVRQLRGTLEIQSDAGTTIRVRFPAKGEI